MMPASKSHLWLNRREAVRAGAAVGLAALVSCALAVTAMAQNATWDGGGANGDWGTAANWAGDASPFATSSTSGTLSFAGSMQTTATNEAAGRAVNGISFASTAGAFTLTGSAITLGGNVGFSANPSAVVTQTINLDMAVSSGRSFDSQANGSLVVNGVISGSGGVVKGQLGSTTFAGANTFTGALDVRAGTAIATTIAASGSASSIGAGSYIALGGPAGSTATTLTYTGTATAPITVNRAVALPAANSNAGGTITNNGSGPLVFNGVFTNSGASGTKSFTLGGSNNGGNDFQSVIINGTVGGAVAVTKAGIGIWTLSGANTFTGNVSVTAGTLWITSLADGAANALGVGSQVNLGSGATFGGNLAYTGSTAGATNRTIVLAATTTGQATISNNGSGPVVFGGALTNLGTSGTKTFTLGGSNTGDNEFRSTIADGAGGVLGLTKSGIGVWKVSGTNTFSGAMAIAAGTLKVTSLTDAGQASSLGTAGAIRVGGGAGGAVLDYVGPGGSTNRTIQIGTNSGTPAPTDVGGARIRSNGSGPLVFTSATFNATGLADSLAPVRTLTLGGTNGGTNAIQGVIVDGLAGTMATAVTKEDAGVWELSAVNTYSGTTTVSGGTLKLGAAGSIANSPTANVAAGASFDVSALAGGYGVPSGQTLAGSGTVVGSAVFGSAATLSPGATVGMLTTAGELTWNPGGNYNWQILSGTGGAGDPSSWDLASVTGTLTIASTSADSFRINLWTIASTGTGGLVSGSAANFNPSSNYVWKIASATGGISGFSADKFSIGTSATNGTDGFANDLGGGTFSLSQSGNDLNLVFSAGGGPSVITINVASGTQTQAAAGYPTLFGLTPVAKTGGGTLVVDQANTLTGSTAVQGGVLQLANAAALGSSKIVPLAGGTVSLTPYLETSVGGLAPNAGGLVDVGSGRLTVASGLTANDLVTAIVVGRGDGSWTGTRGITSSTAAASVASGMPRSVGWLDNGDGSLTVAYAAPGDTNIDWSIDILDVSNFLALGKFDTGEPATWVEGDFSYDGIVDILDAADFFATGLYDTGNYNSPPGMSGVAAVPEPTGTAGLAVAFGAGLWLARRGSRGQLPR